jgi:hypothetical protein
MEMTGNSSNSKPELRQNWFDHSQYEVSARQVRFSDELKQSEEVIENRVDKPSSKRDTKGRLKF